MNLIYYKTYFQGKLRDRLRPVIKSSQRLYKSIGILDPSIGTANLGDLIISEAVSTEIKQIFPTYQKVKFPSQLYTDFDTRTKLEQQDVVFVGGTNLLASNLDVRHQWKVHPGLKRRNKLNMVLMGTGWWQYQSSPNNYTINLLNSILSSTYTHSVRDGYTMNKLKGIGLKNVVNTGCPTMWGLSKSHCKNIPVFKSTNVVTTLTCYKQDVEKDRRMLEILANKYARVMVWIQGLEDVEYLNSLNLKFNNIELIPPTIEHFNDTLSQPEIDYVGTRLHAGIRALQLNKRTIIIAVDNRAVEIGKDTNLNVIPRSELERVHDFIDHEYVTAINLPEETIKEWKAQFVNL